MLVSGVLPQHGAAGRWDHQRTAAEHGELVCSDWVSLPRACDLQRGHGLGVGVLFLFGCWAIWLLPTQRGWEGEPALVCFSLGLLAGAPAIRRGWSLRNGGFF